MCVMANSTWLELWKINTLASLFYGTLYLVVRFIRLGALEKYSHALEFRDRRVAFLIVTQYPVLLLTNQHNKPKIHHDFEGLRCKET